MQNRRASARDSLSRYAFEKLTRRRWWQSLAKRSVYTALRAAYPFDRWHCRIVRENCRYFDSVRALHRELRPDATVEVGCGLGEIISGLESPILIGVDRDAAVIGAARLLRGRRVTFLSVSELERMESLLGQSSGPCLLFLNWFHVYRPEEVQEFARAYVRRTNATHVMFDVINEGSGGYRFRHSPEVLHDIGSIITVRDAEDGIRRLVALRANHGSQSARVNDENE